MDKSDSDTFNFCDNFFQNYNYIFFSLSCLPSKPSHVPNTLYWLLVANKWCWSSFLVWLTIVFPHRDYPFLPSFPVSYFFLFWSFNAAKTQWRVFCHVLDIISIFCPLYFLSCLLPQFFLSKLLRVVFFDAVHFAHPLFCVIDVFLFFSLYDICRN